MTDALLEFRGKLTSLDTEAIEMLDQLATGNADTLALYWGI